MPSGSVSGHNDLGGRWSERLLALLFWGCRHTWGKHTSGWDCSQRQQTTEGPSYPHTRGWSWGRVPCIEETWKGPVESKSWDPLEDGLNLEWAPLPTSRSISWEWKFPWPEMFDQSLCQITDPPFSCVDTEVTTRKPGLKTKTRTRKQNWEESPVTSHCRGHRFHRIHPGKLLNS